MSNARPVDNSIYSNLGARWYEAEDDPVALLRAEARHRNPWVAERLEHLLGPGPKRVLDVGCGAGFLANALALRGHEVTGLDAAQDSLRVAALHDVTGRVSYEHGDALALPHADASFDAVCAMDFLEHVEEPERSVAEAARVLAPGGLYFFHTFNRSWLSWLVVIKGVEWLVPNTPRDMHVLRLFVKPAELRAMCAAHGLETLEVRGSRPRLDRAALRALVTRRIGDDFRFVATRATPLGYTGVARKRGARR